MISTLPDWLPQRSPEDNAVAVVKNLFRLHEVQITDTAVERQLPKIPAYPSLGAMKRFLDAWGFSTLGIQMTPADLADLMYPAIAFLQEGQFVLLVAYQDNRLLYLHPRSGWREETLETFAPNWSGHVLMAVPGEDSFEPSYDLKRQQEISQLASLRKTDKVTIHDAFLEPEVCNHLMALAATRFKCSQVLNRGVSCLSPTRTCSSASLPKDDMHIRDIYSRCAAMLETPSDHFETLQCHAYTPNQEFQPHHDAFGPFNQQEIDDYGQRVSTILFYLNTDFCGGETHFPLLDLRITPNVGRAVVFHNLDASGQLDPDVLHAGLSILQGMKYVATLWVRDRPYVEAD